MIWVIIQIIVFFFLSNEIIQLVEYLSIPPFPKITITVDSGDNKQEGEGNNQNSDSKENSMKCSSILSNRWIQ